MKTKTCKFYFPPLYSVTLFLFLFFSFLSISLPVSISLPRAKLMCVSIYFVQPSLGARQGGSEGYETTRANAFELTGPRNVGCVKLFGRSATQFSSTQCLLPRNRGTLLKSECNNLYDLSKSIFIKSLFYPP